MDTSLDTADRKNATNTTDADNNKNNDPDNKNVTHEK